MICKISIWKPHILLSYFYICLLKNKNARNRTHLPLKSKAYVNDSKSIKLSTLKISLHMLIFHSKWNPNLTNKDFHSISLLLYRLKRYSKNFQLFLYNKPIYLALISKFLTILLFSWSLIKDDIFSFESLQPIQAKSFMLDSWKTPDSKKFFYLITWENLLLTHLVVLI